MVLLVYPKTGAQARNVSLYPPLPLLYLASYLDGYRVEIYDQRLEGMERFEGLLSQGPVCVGFSIMTGVQIKFALELAQIVKARNIPTVFGGVHPTILPHQTQDDERVDYVVAGEGELAFRELLSRLVRNDSPDSVIMGQPVDLDNLPELPYYLIDVENYVHNAAIDGRSLPFVFSRGCPFDCVFCCNPVTSKRKWRSMAIEPAIEQLDRLVSAYRLDSVIFWDENLAANTPILNRLAGLIGGRFNWFAQTRSNSLLKHDLHFLEEMGARRLSCGLESGSPKVLKAIKKRETVEEFAEANRRLAETGINVWYNYIVGFPGETREDIEMTVRLALQMLDENPNAANSTFALLVPYPGTEVGEQYFTSIMPDNLQDWSDFGRDNFDTGWYSPNVAELYSRICFSSKFVGRRIEALFPDNVDLKATARLFTDKWREFDFFDDKEWEQLREQGWKVLVDLFGDAAY